MNKPIEETVNRIRSVSVGDARVNLGQVVRRVSARREYFALEEGGLPVAGILSIQELEDYLELCDPAATTLIGQSRREYKRGEAHDADQLFAPRKRDRPESQTIGDTYRVLSTPTFDTRVEAAAPGRPRLGRALRQSVAILHSDPLNSTGKHEIKQLPGVAQGDGQWRIRHQEHSIRYDIVQQDVVLHSFRELRPDRDDPGVGTAGGERPLSPVR